jgi:hypothetical protein
MIYFQALLKMNKQRADGWFKGPCRHNMLPTGLDSLSLAPHVSRTKSPDLSQRICARFQRMLAQPACQPKQAIWIKHSITPLQQHPPTIGPGPPSAHVHQHIRTRRRHLSCSHPRYTPKPLLHIHLLTLEAAAREYKSSSMKERRLPLCRCFLHW